MSGSNVETLTVIPAGLDPSNFVSGMTQIAASAQRGGDAVAAASTKAAGSWVAAGTAAERYARQVNAQYDSVQKYAKAYDAISKALEVGRISADAANATLAGLASRYGALTAAAQAALERIGALNAAIRASSAGASVGTTGGAAQAPPAATGTGTASYSNLQATSLKNYQAALAEANAAEAAGALTAAQANTERQKSIAVYSDYSASIDKARASIDPLFAASKQYEDELTRINAAAAASGVNESVHAAAIDRLNASYAEQTGTAKALGLATDSVGRSMDGAAGYTRVTNSAIRESVGVARDLAFGLSPLEIALLRFGQAEHVLENLGGIFKSAVSFLVSPVGIILEAATAFGTLAYSAESSARRIEALRNELALVRDDFAAISTQAEATARHLASTSILSTGDAQAGVGAVEATPGFNGSPAQVEAIVKAFNDLSTAQGKSALDSKQLGDALRDPTAFLTEMEPVLKNVDSDLVEHARLLQAAGDKAGAFALALRAVQDATASVQHNFTPLQQAFHNLEQAMSGAGAGGRGFIQEIGQAFDNIAARIVNGVANIIAALTSAGHWIDQHFPNLPGSQAYVLPQGMVPTTSYGGVAGGASAMVAPGGGLPAYDLGAATAIVNSLAAKGMTSLDAIALAAQAIAESGGQYTKVGDPGIQPGVDPTYGAYPGGSHGLFQINRGRLANFMGQNQGLLPEQTSPDTEIAFAISELANDFKNVAAAAARAPNLDTKSAIYTARYEIPGDVPGQIPIRRGLASDLQARFAAGGAAGATPGYGAVVNPEGGPTSTTGTGLDNVTKDYVKLANDLSSGTPEARVRALQASLEDLDKSLATDPGNQRWLQEKQALTLELYNTVPAATAAVRAIESDIAASNRMAIAWGEGAGAAASAEIQNKALTEALKIADPATKDYAAAVALLTGELTKQAAATQRAQVAQQDDQIRQIIAYTQLETNTLGMNAEARDVLLAKAKALQELQAKDPQLLTATDAASAALVKTTLDLASANATAADSYKTHQAAINELANTASQAFNAIGSGISDMLVGKAVNWQTIVQGIVKNLIDEFLKLAVINPLLNSLGLGGAGGSSLPTLGTVSAALGGLFGPAAAGAATAGAAGAGGFFGAGDGSGGFGDVGAAEAGGAYYANAIPGTPDLGLMAIGNEMGTPGIYHGGGVVGFDAVPFRFVHPSYFDSAPRFHQGLGADEFAAILQRGERVLTGRQQDQVTAAASGGPSFTGDVVFNVPNLTDKRSVDSFARSVPQMLDAALTKQTRAKSRNG